MDDTNDKPLIATRVTTLQEAVELSLKEPWNKNCLFDYSRLLKAFEATTKSKLKPVEQAAAFTHWWNTAKSRSWLPSDASFDEYHLEFADTFTKTNTPHGANPLHEAIHRADAEPTADASRALRQPPKFGDWWPFVIHTSNPCR